MKYPPFAVTGIDSEAVCSSTEAILVVSKRLGASVPARIDRRDGDADAPPAWDERPPFEQPLIAQPIERAHRHAKHLGCLRTADDRRLVVHSRPKVGPPGATLEWISGTSGVPPHPPVQTRE